MNISQNKTLEQRKKLQRQRERNTIKLKALQVKLKKSAQQMAQIKKQEETDKKMIVDCVSASEKFF